MTRVWLLVLMLSSLAVPPLNRADAHGLGKQRLERVEAGPFRISAWTDPSTATTDAELHVTVAVEDENGLVRRAMVQVTAQLQSDASVVQTRTATHERAANKLQYEAALNLADVGDYDMTIVVNKDDNQAQVGFMLSVEDGGGLPVSPGWLVAAGAGMLLVTVVVWNRIQLFRNKKELEQAL